MGGSFRIARITGIDLKVHWTFLLIILWGALGGVRVGGGVVGVSLLGAAVGVASVLLLFVCVTLHEFGHALVARRFGVPVREIYLLPIGGVAMLSRSPSKPVHELLIAIAGPLVNVAILAILVPVLVVIAGGPSRLPELGRQVAAMTQRGTMGADTIALTLLVNLVLFNLMLILFNLIPAFPLDGGRVLRSLLWMRMPMPRATRIASRVGQVFAVILGLWGLYNSHLMLMVIAFFVFISAGAESAAVQGGSVLRTRRVGDAYNKFALTLSLDDRVSRVIEYVLTSYQPDFAVLNRGRLQGVVTREDVLKFLSANDYDVFVTEVMRQEVLRVDAQLFLDEVIQRMEDGNQRLAAVFDGETYMGLVSSEDIAEAQLVLTFLQRGPAAGSPSARHIRNRQPAAERPAENIVT